jgi:hypothetical protein
VISSLEDVEKWMLFLNHHLIAFELKRLDLSMVTAVSGMDHYLGPACAIIELNLSNSNFCQLSLLTSTCSL